MDFRGCGSARRPEILSKKPGFPTVIDWGIPIEGSHTVLYDYYYTVPDCCIIIPCKVVFGVSWSSQLETTKLLRAQVPHLRINDLGKPPDAPKAE